MSKISNEALKMRRNCDVWEFFLILKNPLLWISFEERAGRVTECHQTVPV